MVDIRKVPCDVQCHQSDLLISPAILVAAAKGSETCFFSARSLSPPKSADLRRGAGQCGLVCFLFLFAQLAFSSSRAAARTRTLRRLPPLILLPQHFLRQRTDQLLLC